MRIGSQKGGRGQNGLAHDIGSGPTKSRWILTAACGQDEVALPLMDCRPSLIAKAERLTRDGNGAERPAIERARMLIPGSM
jgi:hypothetical protein